ncbi:excisionase family DNA-binding protein [Nocardia miyunensis]|uniref:excisionase family DNA-binding protein n=1 Tax=Nocardia miyunensis TaxID=282684 RepID=UPI00082D391A|nr:excisionase family DNA-binding protein [Nocardia miyunensis]
MSEDVEDMLKRLMDEPTVSVSTAARLLGIGRSTAYAAVNSGEMPAIRIRSRFRIPAPWLRHRLQLQTDPQCDTA